MSIRRPASGTPRGSSQPSRSLDDVLRVGMNRLTVSTIGMALEKRPASNTNVNEPKQPRRENEVTDDEPMQQEGGEQEEQPTETSQLPPAEKVNFLDTNPTEQGFKDEVQRIELAMNEHYDNLYTWTQPYDAYLHGITIVSSTVKFLELIGLMNEDEEFHDMVNNFLEIRPEFLYYDDDEEEVDETSVPQKSIPSSSNIEISFAAVPIGMPVDGGQEGGAPAAEPFSQTFELESFEKMLFVPFYTAVSEFKTLMRNPKTRKGGVLKAVWKMVCQNALLITNILVGFADTGMAGQMSDTIRKLQEAAEKLASSDAKTRLVKLQYFARLATEIIGGEVGLGEFFGVDTEKYRIATHILEAKETPSASGVTSKALGKMKKLYDNGLSLDLIDPRKNKQIRKYGTFEYVLEKVWKFTYSTTPQMKIGVFLLSIIFDTSSKCLHHNRELMRVFLKENSVKMLKIKIKGHAGMNIPGIWQKALDERFLPMKPNKPKSLRYNKTLGENGGNFVKEPIPPRKKDYPSHMNDAYEAAKDRYCLAKKVYDQQEQDVYSRNSVYRNAKDFYNKQWKEYQEDLDTLAFKLKEAFCDYADRHKRLGKIFKVPTKEGKRKEKTTIGEISKKLFENPLLGAVRKATNTVELGVRRAYRDEIEKHRTNIAEIFDMLRAQVNKYSSVDAVRFRGELQEYEKRLNDFKQMEIRDKATGLDAKYWPVPSRAGRRNEKLERMQAYEANWKYTDRRQQQPKYKRKKLKLNLDECEKMFPKTTGTVVAPQAGDDEEKIDCGPVPDSVDGISNWLDLLTINEDNGGYEFEEDSSDNDMWSEDGDNYGNDEYEDDEYDDGAGVGIGR